VKLEGHIKELEAEKEAVRLEAVEYAAHIKELEQQLQAVIMQQREWYWSGTYICHVGTYDGASVELRQP
jgi:hypothetical protein